MKSHIDQHSLEKKTQNIRLLVLDVDGVLTDGKLYFSNSGEEMKSFHTLDGHGIKMLRNSGVEVGIITGRTSKLVEKRASDLGIHLLIQGREDKFTALGEMLETFPCELDEIAFLGDDYPDLTVMVNIGLPLAVANAHIEVCDRAIAWTTRNGGDGAVREACDFIMRAQGTYEKALRKYTGE